MRWMLAMLLVSGLPFACINTCGWGSGGNQALKVESQEVYVNTPILFPETSTIQFSFSIYYVGQPIAFLPGGFSAYACSPAPPNFQDTIEEISITSNAALYGIPAGDELNGLFLNGLDGANPLEFPIDLSYQNGIELLLAGPIPVTKDHTFQITSKTSTGNTLSDLIQVSFE